MGSHQESSSTKPEMRIHYSFERDGKIEEGVHKVILPNNVEFGILMTHIHAHAEKVFEVHEHTIVIKSRHAADLDGEEE